MVAKTPKDGFLPLRVSTVDNLISSGGVERGNTLLLSGGCGSGKTIFLMQSLYNAALNGEKVAYFSLEEDTQKIKRHMLKNFGWDIEALEKKGVFYTHHVSAMRMARDIELTLDEFNQSEKNYIENILDKHPEISLIDAKGVSLPFHPDRIAVDSLSALSNSFMNKEKYRLCIQVLVESLNAHQSLNILVSETEQDPKSYGRVGVEEFLVDGVIVLYNLRKGQLRRRAIEILKLRCSEHVQEVVPYRITQAGIELMPSDSKLIDV